MVEIKLNVSKGFMVFIGFISVFVIAGYAGQGQFNLPLAWILDDNGISVDADNNGRIDDSDKLEGLRASDLMASGGSSGGGVTCQVICNGACPAAPPGYTLTQSSGSSGAGYGYETFGTGFGFAAGRCANSINPTIGGNIIEYSFSGSETLCCYFADLVTSPSSPSSQKQIFITSTTYTGNLGGEAGADSKCQQRAQIAGLTGSFKAMLLDGTKSDNIIDKFPKREYINTKGDIVIPESASSSTYWQNLGDVNYDEFGNAQSGSFWTGFASSGQAGASCQTFSNDESWLYLGIYASSSSFPNDNLMYCDNPSSLLCFEV